METTGPLDLTLLPNRGWGEQIDCKYLEEVGIPP